MLRTGFEIKIICTKSVFYRVHSIIFITFTLFVSIIELTGNIQTEISWWLSEKVVCLGRVVTTESFLQLSAKSITVIGKQSMTFHCLKTPGQVRSEYTFRHHSHTYRNPREQEGV
jgi:hypothetical protein